MDEVIFRRLITLPELAKLQELEIEIWSADTAVPLHQTLTVAKNGGIILGAFQGELMIGLLYSFPGYLAGSVYLCSHMMGIRKGYRHGGVGERLKLAQAEAARALGYKLVTWTYDPLETANGYLNIGKLGAVCSTYIANCYGEMQDSLNGGLPSDRFQVAWWLNVPRPVPAALPVVELVDWRKGDSGLPEPVAVADSLPGSDNILSVVVPANFQQLKERELSTALSWRTVTARAFTACFAAGWVVAGFERGTGDVHRYLLYRREALGLPQEPWKRGD